MSVACASPSENGPRAYSYIRFSTPEQALGDSERRQLDGAKRFAEEIGLPFDESLRMTDRGRSGFHGHHRTKGALGEFLKRVEAGEVPVGSILLVENIDRLGREEFLTAFETISKILRAGIKIQTLMPRATYTRESLNEGMIYELVGQMRLAHQESLKKSERGLDNWIEKREQVQKRTTVLTSQCPKWLKYCKDTNSFEVIPDVAESIRRVFELKLAGLGRERIAIVLNGPDSPWWPTAGWHSGYVKRALKNRSVIGEFQPQTWNCGNRKPAGEPIPGYFPAIVETDLFYAVQEQLKLNQARPGRKDKVGNLFTGIATCGYCGGRMPLANKGRPPKGRNYLRCSDGQRGVRCKRRSIGYDEVERLVLENCRKLDPAQLLPSADANAKKVKSLRLSIQGKQAQTADLEQQSDNLVVRMPKANGELYDKLAAQFEQIRLEKERLTKEVQQLSIELRNAEQDANSVIAWQGGLDELQTAIAKDDAVELRLRLREHLRGFIEKIEIFADGWEHLYEQAQQASRPRRKVTKSGKTVVAVGTQGATGEDIAEVIEALVYEYVPSLRRDPRLPKFIEHVRNRRMSKDGRFIRVHFKTGAVLTLVPSGSLASGMELSKTGDDTLTWKFVGPDLDQLWREFTEHQPKTAKAAKRSRKAAQKSPPA